MKASWWAVAVRFLLHGLVVSAWVSRIPAVKSALGLTDASLGLCLLGTAVGSVGIIPVAGWLVTRYGSKRVTAWSSVGFSAALVGPSLATNASGLFAVLVVYGAMAGLNDVSMNAQGVAVENALASPTMSRFHAMFSIGGMAGAFVGALTAAHGISTRAHLVTASFLFILLSVCSSPWLFEAQDHAAESGFKALRIHQLPTRLLLLATVGFCLFLSEGAISDWTGVYLKQVLRTTVATASYGYAAFSTGMAIFRLLGDSITARFGAMRTVRTGALTACAGLTLALSAHSPVIALPGFALTGVGFSVIIPLVFAAGGRVSSVSSGAGVALVSGLGYIGFLIGPPLIGLLAQLSTLRAALFLLVALSLVAAAFAPSLEDQRHSG